MLIAPPVLSGCLPRIALNILKSMLKLLMDGPLMQTEHEKSLHISNSKRTKITPQCLEFVCLFRHLIYNNDIGDKYSSIGCFFPGSTIFCLHFFLTWQRVLESVFLILSSRNMKFSFFSISHLIFLIPMLYFFRYLKGCQYYQQLLFTVMEVILPNNLVCILFSNIGVTSYFLTTFK